MAGSLTTITVKDNLGVNRTMRVWDESGTGVGPYQFVKIVAKADGAPIDPATSAKQPAPGTAGAPAADVITVQGHASMTPFKVGVQVSGSDVSEANPMPVNLGDAGAAISQSLRILSQPIWAEPLSGRLRVVLDPAGGAQTLGTVSTVTTIGSLTNLAQIGGVAADTMVLNTMMNTWANTVRRTIS